MSDELINESISHYVKHVKNFSQIETGCKNKFEILKAGTRISFVFASDRSNLPFMTFSTIFRDKRDIQKWDKICEHIKVKLN